MIDYHYILVNIEFGLVALKRMRSNAVSSLPLRGLSTPGQGQGEGSAGDKSRVSGTQETVEGAGANVPGSLQIF